MLYVTARGLTTSPIPYGTSSIDSVQTLSTSKDYEGFSATCRDHNLPAGDQVQTVTMQNNGVFHGASCFNLNDSSL
jgi:hypothetical protein